MSMVVTLNAGRVIVKEDPLAAMLPAATGCTDAPPETCVCAEAAVI
jgi:hypothetical protein